MLVFAHTLGDLSDREAQVAALVSQAKSNEEIAAELQIAPNTVKTHIRNIQSKTGHQSRISLAVWCDRQLRQPVEV